MHVHSHPHDPPRSDPRESDTERRRRNRAFAVGIVLNLAFVAAEVAGGLVSGSLALLADAGHNLGDVATLLLAWGASLLAGTRPTARRTYGLRRGTILAALASAVLLLVALGAIAWEAIERLADPPAVATSFVVAVAAAGVAVNGATALLFLRGSRADLNVRGAFLHMAADAAVSLAVVVAGITIAFTGWSWLDPVLSLGIVLVVFATSWSLTRDSFDLAVDAVPSGIDPGRVRDYLESRPGVADVHDLHIWGLSTTQSALTAHLVIPEAAPGDDFLQRTVGELERRFGIGHATLQIERGDAEHPCERAAEECR